MKKKRYTKAIVYIKKGKRKNDQKENILYKKR